MENDKTYYVITERESVKHSNGNWEEMWKDVVCVTDSWFEALGYLRYLIVCDEEYVGKLDYKIIEEKEMEEHDDNGSNYNLIVYEDKDGKQVSKQYSVFKTRTLQRVHQINQENSWKNE